MEPWPPLPRSLPGSSSTGTNRARTTGWTTSWATRSPRRRVSGVVGSRLTRLTLISPAVAGVDRARRVDQAEPEAVREPGAGVHETGVPLGDRHRHAGADQRPLQRRQLDVLGDREVGAGVAGQRVGGRRRAGGGQLDRHVELGHGGGGRRARPRP